MLLVRVLHTPSNEWGRLMKRVNLFCSLNSAFIIREFERVKIRERGSQRKMMGDAFIWIFSLLNFFQRGGLLFFFHNSRVNGNWPSAIQVTGGQYKRTAGEFHESIGHAIHFSSETTKNLLNDWTQKKIFSFFFFKKKLNGQIELWDFIVQRIWFSEMIYFNDRSFKFI